MEIVLIIALTCIVGLVLWLAYKGLRWMLRTQSRRIALGSLLALTIIVFAVNNLFFSEMEFIQSQVYPNLYLVKNLEKDSLLVQQAIVKKVKEHLANPAQHGKKLAYRDTTGVYFYEYTRNPSILLFADYGTAYFLDNEEDLGGFVSEELGMYTQYRLAECYVDPCNSATRNTCLTIDYFYEGDFVKTDIIFHPQLTDLQQ